MGRGSRRPPVIGREQSNQRGLGSTVVKLAGKQGVSGWKQLQRKLAGAFFVLAVEVMRPLPCSRLDDRNRDLTARNDGLKRACCAAILEAGRRTLLGHCLCALDHGLIGSMVRNPTAHCERVNALFRASANSWNVDRIDEPRCRAVVHFDKGESTTYPAANAQTS